MKIIIHASNRKRHNCVICQKEFIGTPKQKTCSAECLEEYKKSKRKRRGAPPKAW